MLHHCRRQAGPHPASWLPKFMNLALKSPACILRGLKALLGGFLGGLEGRNRENGPGTPLQALGAQGPGIPPQPWGPEGQGDPPESPENSMAQCTLGAHVHGQPRCRQFRVWGLGFRVWGLGFRV